MTGLLPCFVLTYKLADIVLNIKTWCLVNLELSEQTFLEDKRLKDLHLVREKFCSHTIREMLILTMLQNTLALKCYEHVLYRYCAETYLCGFAWFALATGLNLLTFSNVNALASGVIWWCFSVAKEQKWLKLIYAKIQRLEGLKFAYTVEQEFYIWGWFS